MVRARKPFAAWGELNNSAQARWLRTVEAFNDRSEARQLKLFPSHVAAPSDDPQVARVLIRGVGAAIRTPAIRCRETEQAFLSHNFFFLYIQ